MLVINGRCSHEEKVSMRLYTSPDAAAAKLPFSQAVQVGDVLYLSGALGHKPGTREVVAGGIEAETRQTMENIGAVLKANGLTFDDVFNAR
jgi:2-iminobutanoate/2-iminopropanoate deaminase